MKRRSLYFIKWVLNLFKFAEPNFKRLEFLDFIVADESYLLINVMVRNAFFLQVKEIRFYSFSEEISAYVSIPSHLNQITISIANSWHSKKETVFLNKTVVDGKVNFNPQFTEKLNKFHQIKPPNMSPKLVEKPVFLDPFTAKVSNSLNISSVTNINYN